MKTCTNKKLTGKLLAYVLRHDPAAAGIELDANGWAKVDELLIGVQRAGRFADMNLLEEIVARDDKGRFAFNGDKGKIRAVQGHSIGVDLELEEKIPPAVLYHGTAEKYVAGIKTKGIERRNRNFVHLSLNEQTAVRVGARHGKPVVLAIAAEKMHQDGYRFFCAENGVWLTEYVPFQYVTKLLYEEVK